MGVAELVAVINDSTNVFVVLFAVSSFIAGFVFGYQLLPRASA